MVQKELKEVIQFLCSRGLEDLEEKYSHSANYFDRQAYREHVDTRLDTAMVRANIAFSNYLMGEGFSLQVSPMAIGCWEGGLTGDFHYYEILGEIVHQDDWDTQELLRDKQDALRRVTMETLAQVANMGIKLEEEQQRALLAFRDKVQRIIDEA